MILLVAFSFGMVFCFQSSFLERLAEAQSFGNIKLFFVAYCLTAILFRVVFRRLPQRIGRSRTVVLGLVLLGAGLLSLVGASTELGLMLPGLLMGAGHCFIFPSMVDLAADCFPASKRGTGTALVLGAGDLGLLVGYVLLGELIDVSDFDAAVRALVAVVGVSALCFLLSRRVEVFRLGARTRSPAALSVPASGGAEQGE